MEIDYHLETACKLYKFEAIKDLRFMENVYYEDAPYTLKALNTLKKTVLVPKVFYHYFSHPNSTIKKKSNKKLRQDKILTNLDLITYAQNNNLILKKYLVNTEDHFFWKIKHHIDKKEYYLCGIKIFTRYIPYR